MSARLRELMPRATDLAFLRRRGGLLKDPKSALAVLHRSKRKSVVHDEAAKRVDFGGLGPGRRACLSETRSINNRLTGEKTHTSPMRNSPGPTSALQRTWELS